MTIPHVEEAITIDYVSDLFILVEVLVKEHLYFFLVYWAHLLWRYNDLVSILVRPLRGNVVNRRYRRAVVVKDAELAEVVRAYSAPRIMVFTLIALGRCQV